MSVRSIIYKWLPYKFRKYIRFSQFWDVVSDFFGDVHDDITSLPDYLNIDKVGDGSDFVTDITDEVLAIGDSSTLIFNTTMGTVPVVYDSITLTYTIGNSTIGTLVISGTSSSNSDLTALIDYGTGTIRMEFNTQPVGNITATYQNVTDGEYYLNLLENMFNFPDGWKRLDMEDRRFFLTRVADVIQLKGLERIFNIVQGLLSNNIEFTVKWTNDAYDTFSLTEIVGGFKAPHINARIGIVEETVTQYYDYVDEILDYLLYFKPVEVVLDLNIELIIEDINPIFSPSLFIGEIIEIEPA